MSVTSPKGFRASGVAAGIKAPGLLDVAVVINDGPRHAAAGVFTSNRFQAAPVLWSQDVVRRGRITAVALNSGGANACTGAAGYADTVATAEHLAELLDCPLDQVAVSSTGLIGARLPMQTLLAGLTEATAAATDTPAAAEAAATAILTTDTCVKQAHALGAGYQLGGMAKGSGMLAPELATMLVVITTDAVLDPVSAQESLAAATTVTFNRIDSDGCMSTNDAVLLLASGASQVSPTEAEFTELLTELCDSLAQQLIADAEGASKEIRVDVVNALTEADAVSAARTVARSNLLKCAIHGGDPNWGRVLSALGTSSAQFEPDQVDVAINGIWVCRGGEVGEDRNLVDMAGRHVTITINLNAGVATGTIRTNDLTAGYVHENSSYSS